MLPFLIDLGRHELPFLGEVHLALPTYGVLFALAALLAGWWFLRRARTLGLREDLVYNLAFYSLLTGVLGAKATLILLDWRYYLEDPTRLVGTLRIAGVLLGGVLAGAVTFAWYARRHGLPVMALGDAVAAPLALAQGIGRLGCFAAGCCHGVETHADHPLAVVFSHPACQAPLGRPLIATQLIQMGHDVALAGVLTWLWRRRPEPAGTVFWAYLGLYGLGRATIELWRGDVDRGLFLGDRVSTSQLLALGGAALALVMLLRGRLARRHAALRV